MTRRRRARGVSTLLVILGLLGVLGGTFAAGFLAGRHWERVRVVAGLVKPQAGREPDRGPRDRAVARASDPAPVPLTFYQELTAPLASPYRTGGPRNGADSRGGPDMAPTPPTLAASRETQDAARPPRVPGVNPGPSRPHAAKLEPPKPPATNPEATRLPPKPDVPPESNVDMTVASKPEAKPATKPERSVGPAPEPRPAPSAATGAEGGRRFTVQVAAYASRAQAETLVERLAGSGFASEVSETTTPSGVRYRVRVGTYPTKEAAREAAARLAAETRLGGFVAAR